MGVFNGYLIKNLVNGSTYNSFIQASTYKSKPNQREELVAYRDENSRNLYRETASGKKTKVSFTTVPMDLGEKMLMQNFFNTAMVNADQRKVHLSIWNDEDNTYKDGYFYIPNFEYPIDYYTNDNIYYGELALELIEY